MPPLRGVDDHDICGRLALVRCLRKGTEEMSDSSYHDEYDEWYVAPESADHPQIVQGGDGCAFVIVYPLAVLTLWVLVRMAMLLFQGAG